MLSETRISNILIDIIILQLDAWRMKGGSIFDRIKNTKQKVYCINAQSFTPISWQTFFGSYVQALMTFAQHKILQAMRDILQISELNYILFTCQSQLWWVF